jgi:uncharacterized protein (DUF488 family)
MQALSTIGYERASPETFLATLQAAGVTLLLDVREAPISRRPGFAKNALRAALHAGGIDYRHEQRLGAPKPLRDGIRFERWSYPEFFARYRDHLAAQQDVLARLVDNLQGHVALMCYERDHRECHRCVVAEAMAQRTGVRPRHLHPEAG